MGELGGARVDGLELPATFFQPGGHAGEHHVVRVGREQRLVPRLRALGALVELTTVASGQMGSPCGASYWKVPCAGAAAIATVASRVTIVGSGLNASVSQSHPDAKSESVPISTAVTTSRTRMNAPSIELRIGLRSHRAVCGFWQHAPPSTRAEARESLTPWRSSSRTIRNQRLAERFARQRKRRPALHGFPQVMTYGGSVCESNTPRTLFTPYNGFEDRRPPPGTIRLHLSVAF